MTIFLLVVWSTVSADEVIFENGERLIGTFERVEGDKLIFKSEIAGEISVDISKIKDIYSEKPLEIVLDDGTLLTGKTIKREEDTFTVQEDTGGAGKNLCQGGPLRNISFPEAKG